MLILSLCRAGIPLRQFPAYFIISFPDVRGGFQYNKAQFPRHDMLLSVRFHLKTRFIFMLLIPLFQAVPLFLGLPSLLFPPPSPAGTYDIIRHTDGSSPFGDRFGQFFISRKSVRPRGRLQGISRRLLLLWMFNDIMHYSAKERRKGSDGKSKNP